ncbi:MAG TPA: PilZ domain-containing protein [Myxococcota bacterium]|nr:PilZ domain-containing protein [Myxococcota bacterium]
MSGLRQRASRRYRRRTVRIQVEYLFDTDLRRESATTLGAGGLFIESDAPLAPGSLLKLPFQLAAGRALHEIEGRVVWSKRAELGAAAGTAGAGAGSAGMGIEFLDRAAARALARDLEALD